MWGLYPLVKYHETEKVLLNCVEGTLVALLEHAPTPGISYQLNKDSRWLVYVNKKRGWVRIGNGNAQSNKSRMITFAPVCVAAVERGSLQLFSYPQELPSLDIPMIQSSRMRINS